MTKPTVSSLSTEVAALTAKAGIDEATIVALGVRLDNAGRMVKAMEARLVALEDQDTKTRKQLWYLQKVAKGDFAIGSQAAKEDTVIEAADLSF